MTKDEVRALCESDEKLKWWAMVLFAEISAVANQFSGYRNDDQVIASHVRSRVDEFPRLIIQRQLEKLKEDPDEKAV